MNPAPSTKTMAFSVALCAVAIFSVGVVLVIRFVDQRNIDKVATTTHNALCTFRSDLQRRADDTFIYISELKRGVRQQLPGITIPDLERSLDAQNRTLTALSGLRC